MIISAIVAVAENGVIGHKNQIPWHLPADLKWFKKQTTGHHIILGRKNYDSIGRPLPKRQNFVISRNPDLQIDGCRVFNDIEHAIDAAYNAGESELFIVGGETIYKQTMHLWQKLYITKVHDRPEGDVFFPDMDFSAWQCIFRKNGVTDERNTLLHTYEIWVRTLQRT